MYVKQRSFLVEDDGTNIMARFNGVKYFLFKKSDGELNTKAGVKGGKTL